MFRVFYHNDLLCERRPFLPGMIYPGVEGEAKMIQHRPEDILTPKEAELLQAAEQGKRSSPNPGCGLPLHGEKLIIPGVYEGIVLSCPKEEGGCGFREL